MHENGTFCICYLTGEAAAAVFYLLGSKEKALTTVEVTAVPDRLLQ
jgi:hypothetical protein